MTKVKDRVGKVLRRIYFIHLCLCLYSSIEVDKERERNQKIDSLKGRFQEGKSIPTHLDSEGMDKLSRGSHLTSTTTSTTSWMNS